MIYVFGDSNARIYETMKDSQVFSFSGSSIYEIGKLGIHINVPVIRKSHAIFVFGAVDSRKHIPVLARQSRESEESIINVLMEDYSTSVSHFCHAHELRGYISSIIPESHLSEKENIDERRAIGSLEERVARNSIANLQLMKSCEIHGVHWFDPFDFFRLNDGRLDPSKENKENICHISDEWHYVIHDEFTKASSR